MGYVKREICVSCFRVTGARSVGKKKVEAAGRNFLERYESANGDGLGGKKIDQIKKDVADDTGAEEGTFGHSRSKSFSKSSISTLRIKAYLEGPNLYELLGTTETATPDELKKAYRKIVLNYHPDKLAAGQPAPYDGGEFPSDMTAQERFCHLQEGFEMLNDSELRRQYDSGLPVDDSIPEESDIPTDGKFYDVMRPVFDRNAKWSIERPVPSLGDDSTKIEEVQEFYAFWFHFETWRDYGQYDEHDITTGEDRYEKRAMHRDNQRSRKQHAKKEALRITTLVTRAYHKDPRIMRYNREEAETRKRRKKENKQQGRQGNQQVRHGNQPASQDKVVIAPVITAEEKALLKAWRRSLHGLIKGYNKHVDDAVDIDKLYTFTIKLTLSQVICHTQELYTIFSSVLVCDGQMENGFPADAASYEEWVNSVMKSLNNGDNCIDDNRTAFYQWSKEKFPQATSDRKFTKQPNETSKQSPKAPQDTSIGVEKSSFKDLSSKPVSNGQGPAQCNGLNNGLGASTDRPSDNVLTSGDKTLLAAGMIKFPGGVPNRWEAIASFVGGGMTPQRAALAARTIAISKGDSKDDDELNENHNEPNIKVTPSAQPVHGWTPNDQKKLETALGSYPASMGPEKRWESIAGFVGRSQKECLAQYKYIREQIQHRMGKK